MDLHAAVMELTDRVSVLEERTVSGVPDMTIAERFETHHERADAMGKNILDKIDKRTKELNQKIDHRANQLDEKIYTLSIDTMDGFDRVNQNIAKINHRLDQQGTRIDGLELSMARRFEKVDTDIAELKGGFSRLEGMLISLGAKAPES